MREHSDGGEIAAVRRSGPFMVVAALVWLVLAVSGAPSPLYVDYQAHWHFSAVVLTMIYAAYAGGVVVALLLVGGLSDRVGRRLTLIGCMVGLIASLGLFIAASSVVWLYVARALEGVVTGVFTATASAALADLHMKKDVQKAGLVNSAAQSLGIASGALLAGALAQWSPQPLRMPYVALMVVALGLLAVTIVMVSETVSRTERIRFGTLLRPQRLAVPAAARREFAIAGLGISTSWSIGGIYLALGGSISEQLLHSHDHLIAALAWIHRPTTWQVGESSDRHRDGPAGFVLTSSAAIGTCETKRL